VIALDTNVLARAIAVEMNADAATRAQRKQAQDLLSSGQELFVPVTVIEELEWVLRGAYDMPREDIAALLDDMLAIDNLTVDRAAAVGQSIAWYRQGLDYSDALHLAQSALCAGMASFDAQFARSAHRLGLQPAVASPTGR
jgi:predicted nucleic-acid-binding protein